MEYENSGVLFVDDGSKIANHLWPMIQHLPHRKRLAMAGAPARNGIDDVAHVSGHQIDIKGVVRMLDRQHMLWAVMPRPKEDPAEIVSDFISQARPYLEDGYPAFILGMCRSGVAYRNVAVVVDRTMPITTGALIGAAVALALRTGASLDVLALGVEQEDLEDDPWDLFKIDANGEFVEYTKRTMSENNVEMRWVPLGSSSDRDQLVIEVVRAHEYDAVVDDIREVNIGPRFGRLERVRRGLTEGTVDTCYRLLRDAHCDVYLVLDAARMELFNERQVIAGAGAAMMLGTLAVGASAASPDWSASAPTQQSIEATVEPGAMAAVDEAAAQAEAEAQKRADLAATGIDVPEPRSIPGVDALPAEVSQDQLKAAGNTLSEAQAGLSAEQQELAAAQQSRDATAAAAAAAAAELDSAQSALSNAEAREQALDRAEERAAEDEDALTERQKEQLETERDQLNLQKAAVEMRVDAAEQAAPAAQEAAEQAAAVAEAQQVVTDQVGNEVNQMNALYAEAEQRVATVLPTQDFWVSATFGEEGPYWSRGWHTGLDFAAAQGTPLFAIDDGVVIEAGWGGAYGNYTVIQNSDGTTAHYAHQASMGVSVGQHVSAGQQIGTLGSTGNSTGPHLHFEIRDAAGNFMDPAAYLGM